MEVELNNSSSSSKGETLSEFSSTPNTSVHSTPIHIPSKDNRDEHIVMDVPFPDNPIPSGSKDKAPKPPTGKNLELIKRPDEQCATPSDSLYFSEMTKTKTDKASQQGHPEGKATIGRLIPGHSAEEACPRKSVMNLCNQTQEERSMLAQEAQPTVANQGCLKKAHALQTRYCGTSRNPPVPEDHRTADSEVVLLPDWYVRSGPRFQDQPPFSKKCHWSPPGGSGELFDCFDGRH